MASNSFHSSMITPCGLKLSFEFLSEFFFFLSYRYDIDKSNGIQIDNSVKNH